MVLKAIFHKESPKQSLPQVTSEATVRSCSSKQLFLEISQYSLENNCVESQLNENAGRCVQTSVLEHLFNKVAVLTACNFI